MFKKVSILVVALMVCALSLSGANTASAAAAWPKEKPFTMLIPFATGGTDFNARLVAKIMSDILGVRVNCINRTGGQGVVGHTAIANGTPDGYTIGDIECELNMMHWAGLTDMTYKDLTTIALIVSMGGSVIVNEKSPYKNMKDLVAAIKKNPGKLTKHPAHPRAACGISAPPACSRPKGLRPATSSGSPTMVLPPRSRILRPADLIS